MYSPTFFDHDLSFSILILVGITILLTITTIYRALSSPLRSIPGPFLTRFTRLWYLRQVYSGHAEKTIERLHTKVSIVRLAPDWYSISDPSAIRSIYGFGTKFTKANWYYGWQHPNIGNIFAARDAKDHNERKRKVQALYSMTSLMGYEGLTDEVSDLFINNLPRAKIIDLGHWLQCYAFDVIASITFGQRFGFLDRGEDIDGAMRQLDRSAAYSTLIGIYNELHALLWPLLSRLPFLGARGRQYVVDFVSSRVDARATERSKRDHGEVKIIDAASGKEDFLDRMFNALDEGKVSMRDIYAIGMSNIIAGSDTTSSTLSAVVYELLRHPDVLDKLRSECRDHGLEIGASTVSFQEAFAIPYLSAVIKEGMRLRTIIGLPMWRVVPDGGAELAGVFFPAGSVVGILARVAHLSKEVFGPDAGIFRPERWLEADAVKVKEMEATFLAFGMGSRVCLGRHVSELEMYKVLPRLIMEFDMQLADGVKDFETHNMWFIKPTNLRVQITERTKAKR